MDDVLRMAPLADRSSVPWLEHDDYATMHVPLLARVAAGETIR